MGRHGANATRFRGKCRPVGAGVTWWHDFPRLAPGAGKDLPPLRGFVDSIEPRKPDWSAQRRSRFGPNCFLCFACEPAFLLLGFDDAFTAACDHLQELGV